MSLKSPALAGRFFITGATWEADVPNICEVYLIPESINNKNYSSKQFYYTDHTYTEIIIFQARDRAAPAQGATSANCKTDKFHVPANALPDQKYSVSSQAVP